MPGRGFIVVKLGGRLTLDERVLDTVSADLRALSSSGWRVVLVHGGGDLVTDYSKRLGIEPRFVVSPSGVRSRYTTLEELRVYAMVIAGLVNKTITAYLNSRGLRALGVSGVDCSLLQASRKERIVVVNERGRPQVIPGGYTGKITGVDRKCLERLAGMADVVIVAPLAAGTNGVMLNVDGDQAAAAIAGALRAEALVFLTDVPGVLLDGKLLREVPVREAEAVAARVGHGMKRKILMAARAVEAGVGRAVIADGRLENPITAALEGSGTVVRDNPA